MWLFHKKARDERSRLLELLKRWRSFETIELDQPHLAGKLKELAARLEQEAESLKPVLTKAGAEGEITDVDFLLEVLHESPPSPTGKTFSPEDPHFSWDQAAVELGPVARVAGATRVPIMARVNQSWRKTIQNLEQRVTALAGDGQRAAELEPAKSELAGARQGERDELNRVDQEFRRYLKSLTRLHEFYDCALNALANVKTSEGEREIVAMLANDDRAYRELALLVLKRRNWSPANLTESLDYYIVQAKLPQYESEAVKRLEDLIRTTTEVSDLLDTIEPRLSEEGLTELQAALLDRLCSLHSEKALDRLAQVLASSLEPPAIKVRVTQALPDIGTTRAVELLIKAMDELDMEVRAAAAESLGRVALPPALPTRSEPVSATPLPAEVLAASSLAASSLTAAMERLVFALRDGDVLVREASAKALRHYPAARDRLVTSLTQDRNPNAREYSARALANLEPHPASTEALIKALSDEDQAVRKAAADALTKQEQVPEEPEVRIRYLAARRNWKELRRIGRPATGCLIALLRDRDEEVRLAVVELLGAIRARDAVKNLCVSLSDSSQTVRKQTAIALRLINDPIALDALRRGLAKEGFKEVKAEIEQAIRKLAPND
jgi:HEAT repeat protein